MKFAISMAAVFAALAFVPLASANIGAPDVNQGPCIIYPGYKTVGGFWVGTGNYYVPGQSVTIYFLTVSTQPVTVYGAGAWVPGTTVYTPGVCYGYAGGLIGDIATLA